MVAKRARYGTQAEGKRRKFASAKSLLEVSASERFLAMSDCWQEIARSLDYKSRARCESTCKSVSDLIHTSWTTETVFDCEHVRPLQGSCLNWWKASLCVCSNIGASLISFKMSVDLPITPTGVNLLAKLCPNLESIDVFIKGGDFTAVHLSELRLREVNLLGVGNRLAIGVGVLPSTVETLTGLQGLWEEDINALQEFFLVHPCLKRFELYKSNEMFRVDPKFPLFSMLASSPQMEHLSVVECSNLDLDGIEHLTNLKSLKISYYCGRLLPALLTDEQLVEICARNPRLESLRIAGRDQRLTDLSCEAIATLTNLEELELSGDRFEANFDDLSFRKILTGVGRSLRRLALDRTTELTDASLNTIGKCCSQLRVLVITQSKAEGAFSAVALRQLIVSIAASESFDPVKEMFELYLEWLSTCTMAGQYNALATLGTLPKSVFVRRAFRKGFFEASTIVPPLTFDCF